jgi:putative aminopeptidase FrvX
MPLSSPRKLLEDLVGLPGPPGCEAPVRNYVAQQVQRLGLTTATDPRGNLIVVSPSAAEAPTVRSRVVVTAHLDEIALFVRDVESDGALVVGPLGGVYPWKWGEGPVNVHARGNVLVRGILSFGSVHSDSPLSTSRQARDGRAITWEAARVITGLTPVALTNAGVRPGARVSLGPSRRHVTDLAGGDLVAAHFLDDRADLVAWLLALEADPQIAASVMFVATTSEEVGGEGAQYALHRLQPDVCVALEIGPSTPETPVPLTATPTVWVADSFTTMDPRDIDLLELAAGDAGFHDLYWQALSRGGSDATCAASRGLCARPVTLAFAAENSHGCELMHKDAPAALARLLVSYLKRLLAE